LNKHFRVLRASVRAITGERRLWTVGHSTYDPSELLSLLGGQQMEAVIDVRSTPYSRAAQFNRERLERLLGEAGLGYRWEGAGLGGRPEAEIYYDDEGHALYDRIARMPEFAAACRRVCADVDTGQRLALVCVEENPLDCHRSIFLGRAFAEHGLDVWHIRRGGRCQSAHQLELERTRGQEQLFGFETEAWRSPHRIPRRATTDIGDL
jgi:uncharacterized protein (DUF488 family)